MIGLQVFPRILDHVILVDFRAYIGTTVTQELAAPKNQARSFGFLAMQVSICSLQNISVAISAKLGL